jgi:hypothetical protein
VPRTRGDVADVVDTVVGRGVEFGHVKRRTFGDGNATRTLVAGVTVERIRAVEGLGEDARRRGLPRSARTRKQIGVGNSVVLHRSLKSTNHVVLTAKFDESPWAESSVKRGHTVD